MRARLARLTAAALLMAACAGTAPAETTADPLAVAADDYALSARRAVAGTRFEGLGDDGIASLVIELCDDLAGSSDPDAEVLAFLEGIDAPPGEAVDDQIMAIVLAEGALTVCPEVVDAAAFRAWEAAEPEVRYLTAVAAVAPQLDVELAGDDLVAAGRIVCAVLDGGGSPDEAVVAEFAELFGVGGVSVDEIASGEAGEREGLLAGAVLGGAASFLCPRHQEAVAAYLEALADENAG